MKEFAAVAIEEALENMGIECSTSSDYSGRGMYGKTTWSVTVPSMRDAMLGVASAAISIAETYDGKFDTPSPGDFLEEVRRLSNDSMGRSIVIY